MKKIDFANKSCHQKHERLQATFKYDNGNVKHTHFGFKRGSKYLDHSDQTKLKNYVAWHVVNEQKIWKTPHTTCNFINSSIVVWT